MDDVSQEPAVHHLHPPLACHFILLPFRPKNKNSMRGPATRLANSPEASYESKSISASSGCQYNYTIFI